MKKIVCFTFFVLLFTISGRASTITSVVCGNWTNAATWDLNRVPVATDTIVVNTFVSFDTDFTSSSPGMLNVTACGILCGSHTYTGHFIFRGITYMYTLFAIYGASASYVNVNIQQMMQVTVPASFVVYSGVTCVGCTSHCQNCSTNNRTDSVGCVTASIQKVSVTSEIAIYPNPANETLNIVLQQNETDVLEVKTYDILGKELVYPAVFKEDKYALDILNLPVGIYFVQIKTTAGIFTQKFIKQ